MSKDNLLGIVEIEEKQLSIMDLLKGLTKFQVYFASCRFLTLIEYGRKFDYQ